MQFFGTFGTQHLNSVLMPNDDTSLALLVRAAVEEAIESTLPGAIREAVLPEYLDRGGAANFLSVSVRKVDALRASGALAYSKRGGLIRFAASDLRAYMDAARIAASCPPAGGDGAALHNVTCAPARRAA